MTVLLNGADDIRYPVLSLVVVMNKFFTGPNPAPVAVKTKVGVVAQKIPLKEAIVKPVFELIGCLK